MPYMDPMGCIYIYTHDLHPRLKIISSPLKAMMLGRRSGFLLGETVTFQGRSVKLRGCSPSIFHGRNCACPLRSSSSQADAGQMGNSHC